jgi:hypothetical protein
MCSATVSAPARGIDGGGRGRRSPPRRSAFVGAAADTRHARARLRRGIVSCASAVAPPVLLQVCAPCTLLAARVQLLSCLLLQEFAPSTSFLLAARMRLKNCLKGATLAQLYEI